MGRKESRTQNHSSLTLTTLHFTARPPNHVILSAAKNLTASPFTSFRVTTLVCQSRGVWFSRAEPDAVRAAVGLSSYEAQQAALAEDKNMKKLIQGVFATLTFGIAAVQARRSATSLPAC